MATNGEIVKRRALLQRDMTALVHELATLAGVEVAKPLPRSRQVEHQQNNEWQQVRDTLAEAVPALRAKLERADNGSS